MTGTKPKNGNQTTPVDQIRTRSQTKVANETGKTVAKATPSSRTNASSTTENRMKKLEAKVEQLFKSVEQLTSDMNVMKQQLIDQSRDVNSIILDGSVLQTPSTDFQPARSLIQD